MYGCDGVFCLLFKEKSLQVSKIRYPIWRLCLTNARNCGPYKFVCKSREHACTHWLQTLFFRKEFPRPAVAESHIPGAFHLIVRCMKIPPKEGLRGEVYGFAEGTGISRIRGREWERVAQACYRRFCRPAVRPCGRLRCLHRNRRCRGFLPGRRRFRRWRVQR